MNKLPYEKPEIAVINLNEDIIMASGPCIDDGGCTDNACPDDRCGSVCTDGGSCHTD